MSNNAYRLDPAEELLSRLSISNLSNSDNVGDDEFDDLNSPGSIASSSNVVLLYKEQHDKYDGYELDEKIEKLKFVLGIEEKYDVGIASKVKRCAVLKKISIAIPKIPDFDNGIIRGAGVAVAAAIMFFAHISSVGDNISRTNVSAFGRDKVMSAVISDIDNLKSRVQRLEVLKHKASADENSDLEALFQIDASVYGSYQAASFSRSDLFNRFDLAVDLANSKDKFVWSKQPAGNSPGEVGKLRKYCDASISDKFIFVAKGIEEPIDFACLSSKQLGRPVFLASDKK